MRAALALALVGCVIVPSSSPAPRGPGQPQAGQPLAVAAAPVAPAQDCAIDQRSITLPADRVLRCRGIPFTVTFPQGANVQQEKVGPGTSFLANFEPGITIVGVRPATFEPLVYKDPQGGLDRSLDLIMGLLAQYRPQIEQRYDARLEGAVQGRGLDFSYPLGNKQVAGTVRAFLARGWIFIVLAGGPNDSVVHRGTPAATAFLDSLRVVPVDATPQVAQLETGARLTLPAEAWLNSDDHGNKRGQGILRERMYALPDRDSMLMLQEQLLGNRRCADLMDEQSSRQFLDQHLRSTGEIQFKTLERMTVAGTTALYVSAGVRTSQDAATNAPHYPAGAILFCKEPTYVLAISFGNRSHAEQRATLESILATIDR